MAPDKLHRKSWYMKCTQPYCVVCGSRLSSTPVRISVVRSLENAGVPVSNVPPRAEGTVSIGNSQVSTVQQAESAVGSSAKSSTIGVNHQRFSHTIKPKKEEEKLVENFKNISLDESSTK